MTLPDRPARRRLSSRKVVLTAAFLALAAGGTAACDSSPEESNQAGYDVDPTEYSESESRSGTSTDTDTGTSTATGSAPVVEESDAKQVFYCADEEGEIVDEEYCADDDTSTYFLWHSTGYARGLPTGTRLDGGAGFPANDKDARRAYRLPATGAVRNGTVKTNVVGQNSTGSALGDGTTGGG